MMIVITDSKPKFHLGKVVITPGAFDALSEADLAFSMTRHLRGDWGDCCDEDKRTNDRALKEGLRILSAYRTASDVKFWIITEADRSATTVLLPDEY